MNTSLHVGTEWEDVSDTTRLFAAGGVTTIVCHPFFEQEDTLGDEVNSIEKKKKLIAGKSSVDYCFLANLHEDNLNAISEIYHTPGVVGFKVNLNPPAQAGAGWVKTKKSMNRMTEAICEFRQHLENDLIGARDDSLHSKTSTPPEILLTFHAIKSGGKELTITSPLRESRMQDRLNIDSEIKQTEGDSVLGEIGKKGKSKKSKGSKKRAEGEAAQDDSEDENCNQLEDEDEEERQLSMSEISSCINDNIVDLNEEAGFLSDSVDSLDENTAQSPSPLPFHSSPTSSSHYEGSSSSFLEESPENEQTKYSSPDRFLPLRAKSQSFAGGSPHMNAQMDRQKMLMMYARATIHSADSMQLQLIARAEMKTYSGAILQGDEISKSTSSDSSDGDFDDCDDGEKDQKSFDIQLKMRQRHNSSFAGQSQFSHRFEREKTFCQSPMTSVSSPQSSLSSSPFIPNQHKTKNKSTENLTITSISPIDAGKLSSEVTSATMPSQSQRLLHFNDDRKQSMESFSHSLMSQRRLVLAQKASSESEEDLVDWGKSSECDAAAVISGNGGVGYIPFPTSNPYNYSFEISSELENQKNGQQAANTVSQLSHQAIHTHKLIKVQRVEQEEENRSRSNTGDKKREDDIITSLFPIDEQVNNESKLIVDSLMALTHESLGIKKNQSNNIDSNEKSKTPTPKIALNANKRRSMNLSVAVDQTKDQRRNSIIAQPILILPKMSVASFCSEESAVTPSPKKCSTFKYPHTSAASEEISVLKRNAIFAAGGSDNYNCDLPCVLITNQTISPRSFQNSHRQLILNEAAELDKVRMRGSEDSKEEWTRKISNESCSSTFHNTSAPNPMQPSSNRYQFNQDYLTYLAFRPPYWEYFAVSMIKENFVKRMTTNISPIPLRVLFQNVGNSNTISRIVKLKEDIQKKYPKSNFILHAETAAAFLYFSASRIRNGQTKFKCEPPIGTSENTEFLVNAAKLNLIDVLSSFHFPIDPEFKQIQSGDFRKACSGICTAGYTLQAAWTAINKSACREKEKHVRLSDISYQQNKRSTLDQESKYMKALLRYTVVMLSTKPAKILNISHLKGSITAGKYADLTVWDPFGKSERINIPQTYKFKRVHIFDQKKLQGKIHATILRGNIVYSRNSHTENIPLSGRLLTKQGIL